MGRIMKRRFAVATVLAVGVAVAVTGCGGVAKTAGDPSRVRVVAAENFYGDLAGQIGGSQVAVTSILSNPNTDPHLFEPGTRTGLAVATADVVIVNGAGYDDWMSKLLAAAPSSHRRVVTVADVLGVRGADPNPHLWYDAPALPRVVAAIGAALTRADPAHAAEYRDGVRRTVSGLQPLLAAVTGLKARYAGAAVAYTERVPGLLLTAAGLRVLTPASFARAVEDGTDPSPADVAAMQRLLTGHQVKVLLYNEQATSPVTARLKQTARAAGVPVVPVTETEPAGTTFTNWQFSQVKALEQALGR
jgi:zinc/manganese transport system substrate-binding protein